MKVLGKIVIAGIIGTTFMTLYSYKKARKENEQYVEPVLLNKLIDNSGNPPDLEEEKSHPAGWGLHYATGILFMIAYWILWRKALQKPTIPKILILGSLSGIAGIGVWKLLFAQHDNPPYNNRHGYYRQLFIAHIVFTAFAVAGYKSMSYFNHINK